MDFLILSLATLIYKNLSLLPLISGERDLGGEIPAQVTETVEVALTFAWVVHEMLVKLK